MIHDIEFRLLRLEGKGPTDEKLQMRKLIKQKDSEDYPTLIWTPWKDVPIVRKDL